MMSLDHCHACAQKRHLVASLLDQKFSKAVEFLPVVEENDDAADKNICRDCADELEHFSMLLRRAEDAQALFAAQRAASIKERALCEKFNFKPCVVRVERVVSDEEEEPSVVTSDSDNVVLESNVESVIKNVKLYCYICNKGFKYNSELKAHNERHHSSVRAYKCTKCDKRFKTKHDLNIHKIIHVSTRQYKCSKCSYASKTSLLLSRHIKYVHSNVRAYKCGQCDKTFKRKYSLLRHIQRHSDLRPSVCSECGSSFKNNEDLNVHKRRRHVTGRSFQCEQCEKTFKIKGDLIRHVKSHSDLCPYKCLQCSYSSKHYSNLYKHVLRVHSIVRPYKCYQCDKTFKTKYELTSHLNIHSDERPYKCTQCSYSFNQFSTLHHHVRQVHSNVRSYKCAQCGWAFKRKSHLVVHIERHGDVRAYKCDNCDKCFKTSGDLRGHNIVHNVKNKIKISKKGLTYHNKVHSSVKS